MKWLFCIRIALVPSVDALHSIVNSFSKLGNYKMGAIIKASLRRLKASKPVQTIRRHLEILHKTSFISRKA